MKRGESNRRPAPWQAMSDQAMCRQSERQAVSRRSFLRRALGAPSALLAPGLATGLSGVRCNPGGPSSIVGAKTYSEQLILGEIIARLVEAEGVPVTRRFQMQTFLLHSALGTGDLDCYVEYTGTAYSAILRETFVAGQTAAAVYQRVKQLYEERYDLRLGPPIGFSNDYVVAIRRDHAAEAGLASLSDLARTEGFRLVAGYPFFERADGFRGMIDFYGFTSPPETIQVDMDMVWQVIEAGEADVAIGNSTDGRISKLDLVLLEDDRSWFPPYQSAVAYRPGAVPAVREVAERLGGAIDTETMRALNLRVDVDGEQPDEVAADFLASSGLIDPFPARGAAALRRLPARALPQ